MSTVTKLRDVTESPKIVLKPDPIAFTQREIGDVIKAYETARPIVLSGDKISIGNKNDIQVTMARGKLIVRQKFPDGREIEAHGYLHKYGLRWRDIRPYVYLAIVVATIAFLAWKGMAIVEMVLLALRS